MSQPPDTKPVIDYSKWDDIVEENNDIHIDVQAPFNSQIPSINTSNITQEEASRIKIPRSPRPLPAEPPVLASDGLLEPPPFNAPKGAAAVRHYQVGFGHNIINKNKGRNQKHRKAASMTVFEQMQQFLLDEENNLNTNNRQSQSTSNDNDDSSKEKKYGIKIEDDSTELLKECGELLQFMMQEAKKEEAISVKDNDDDDDTFSSFNPSHHDYYKHNPHEYYRHKAMKTHHADINDETGDIPKIDVIVKMGGAFITNKNKLHTLKPENIDIAAKQISEAFKSNYIMILIHGAGSYGHFEAKKYKLMNGLYNDESRQGMVLCRAAVSILHQNVLAKLMEYRLPVMSVSPNGILTSSDGIISRKQFKPFIQHIKRIIKNGMVPLIHGDIIFDDKRGCHILSGDVILENLSSVFNPQRAVFWSNINGVYDCTNFKVKSKLIQSINVNPKGQPELNVNVVKQLKNPSKFFENQQQDQYMAQLSKKFDEKQKNNESKDKEEEKEEKVENDDFVINIDATGGMWGKVEVAARCCAQGVDVVITKGGTQDAKLALLGKFAENATVFVPSDTLI